MFNHVSKLSSRVVQSSLYNTTRSLIPTTPVFEEARMASSLSANPDGAEGVKEPRRRSKRKKSQKELDKPRRPMSAFSLYYKERRAELGKTNTPPTDAMKQIAERWRQESEDVKAKYNALKEEAKAEYDEKMAEWRAKYPPKLSGYNKFVKANFNKANVTSAAQLPAESKRVAALWRQLTPDEKKEWNNK